MGAACRGVACRGDLSHGGRQAGQRHGRGDRRRGTRLIGVDAVSAGFAGHAVAEGGPGVPLTGPVLCVLSVLSAVPYVFPYMILRVPYVPYVVPHVMRYGMRYEMRHGMSVLRGLYGARVPDGLCGARVLRGPHLLCVVPWAGAVPVRGGKGCGRGQSVHAQQPGQKRENEQCAGPAHRLLPGGEEPCFRTHAAILGAAPGRSGSAPAGGPRTGVPDRVGAARFAPRMATPAGPAGRGSGGRPCPRRRRRRSRSRSRSGRQPVTTPAGHDASRSRGQPAKTTTGHDAVSRRRLRAGRPIRAADIGSTLVKTPKQRAGTRRGASGPAGRHHGAR